MFQIVEITESLHKARRMVFLASFIALVLAVVDFQGDLEFFGLKITISKAKLIAIWQLATFVSFVFFLRHLLPVVLPALHEYRKNLRAAKIKRSDDRVCAALYDTSQDDYDGSDLEQFEIDHYKLRDKLEAKDASGEKITERSVKLIILCFDAILPAVLTAVVFYAPNSMAKIVACLIARGSH